MKILSLSNVPLEAHLGSGKTRLAWTGGLRKLGHEVVVLQPHDFIFLPKLKKAKKFRIAIGAFFKVKKVLKKGCFDFIEFYGDEYWLLLFWLKKIKGKSPLLVAHVDGIELFDMEKEQIFWNKRTGIRKLYFSNTHYQLSLLTFKLADKFVCGCKDDLNYVISRQIFNQEDAICISPGIDHFFHELHFNEEKKNVIVFLGSWIGRKGNRIIPLVLEPVLMELKQYEFHVYGSWNSKDDILNEFNINVVDRVKVFDKLPLKQVIEGLKTSKIFFFPSYSEGFGLATVEAMCCRCAVVTTKTGVGSEIIDNHEALLVEFNDIAGMINAINKLIYDEDFRIKIAYNGYLKAKQYQWDKQIKLLENVYLKWLKNSI